MRNRYFLLVDVLVVLLAALGSFVLRFDWFFPAFQRDFAFYATAAVLTKPAVFYACGMYRRYWRYASISDMVALVLAVSLSSVIMGLIVGVALFSHVIEQFGRSVVLIDSLLTLFGTGAVRLSLRIVAESRGKAGPVRPLDHTRRILVAGAGHAGTMVVREMQRNPQLGMVPVGFVDDDRTKIGKRIYGLPVFGRTAEIADVVRVQNVDEVTIAMPMAPGKVVRAVNERCRAIGIRSRTMPGVYELLDHQVSVSRLRNVEIVDLLRRSQVDGTDIAGQYVTGRAVLITGAGGSIGLELCRQVAHRAPSLLILLGHGENSLFEAHAHLHGLFPHVKLRLVIADIRDERRVSNVFARFRPQIVFHAAAHKHVPLMEDNPEEAVTNNVLGTHCVVQAAVAAGTERLVLISTDKAVSPTSIMGASKRLAECIVQEAARRHGRAFVVVRFGNVLGSRGSVVPIFKQQIERGGPVLITDPEMRRFFMTIPEAVHLVLQAGGMGRGGELFVLRMGEPVRIVDLVHDLIRLSGLDPDEIPIEFTGIRPGEKLEESLWEQDAEVADTEHPDVLQVTEPLSWSSEELSAMLSELASAAGDSDPVLVADMLVRSIPTFAPNRPRAVAAFRTAT